MIFLVGVLFGLTIATILAVAIAGSPNPERWGRLSARPEVRFLEDNRNVELLNNLTYEPPAGWLPFGVAVHMKRGAISDGASIPLIASPIAGTPFTGPHRDGALVHDWLYRQARQGMALCSRARADRMFYYAMRLRGTSAPHALLKWTAVRIGSAKGYMRLA